MSARLRFRGLALLLAGSAAAGLPVAASPAEGAFSSSAIRCNGSGGRVTLGYPLSQGVPPVCRTRLSPPGVGKSVGPRWPHAFAPTLLVRALVAGIRASEVGNDIGIQTAVSLRYAEDLHLCANCKSGGERSHAACGRHVDGAYGDHVAGSFHLIYKCGGTGRR